MPSPVASIRSKTSPAACEVQWAAFESSPEEIEEARALLGSRWRDSPILRHAVWLDGGDRLYGTAARTPHGLLLYGGATLPRARGRGADRALVRARWDDAVSRSTPAPIMQAGFHPSSNPRVGWGSRTHERTKYMDRATYCCSNPSRSRIGRDIEPPCVISTGVLRETASSQRARTSAR